MIWILLFLIFLVIEGLTFNLVTIWFSVGALFAFITSYITDNIIIQVSVFFVVSILSLIITKPILKKFLKNKNEKTNYDRIIGETGVVIKKITKHDAGRVKIDGKDWMAVSDKAIEEGKEVEILKIDGVKILVKEKES